MQVLGQGAATGFELPRIDLSERAPALYRAMVVRDGAVELDSGLRDLWSAFARRFSMGAPTAWHAHRFAGLHGVGL